MSICAHVHVNDLMRHVHALSHKDTGCAVICLAKEKRRFLTIEEGWDNPAGPPQRTCFAESNTEHSRRLAA